MTLAAQVLIFALSCFQSKLDTILNLSFVDPSGQPIQVTVDQQGSKPIAGGKSAPNFRETSVDGKIDVITDKRTRAGITSWRVVLVPGLHPTLGRWSHDL